jgi:hypothetical protein
MQVGPGSLGGVCGVRPSKRLSFSLGVHASVPGRKFCDFIPCKAVYRKGPYDIEGDAKACQNVDRQCVSC